jgi:hypothetical protein
MKNIALVIGFCCTFMFGYAQRTAEFKLGKSFSNLPLKVDEILEIDDKMYCIQIGKFPNNLEIEAGKMNGQVPGSDLLSITPYSARHYFDYKVIDLHGEYYVVHRIIGLRETKVVYNSIDFVDINDNNLHGKEFTDREKLIMKGRYKYKFVESDSNKFFSVVRIKQDKSKKLGLEVKVFGKSFKQVWTKSINADIFDTGFTILQVEVSDSGIVYFLIRTDLSNGYSLDWEKDRQLRATHVIVRVDQNGMTQIEVELEEGGIPVSCNMKLVKDGNIAITGYSGAEGSNADQVYSVQISSDLLDIESFHMPIAEELIERAHEYETAKSRKGYKVVYNYGFLSIREVVSANDGSLYMISEIESWRQYENYVNAIYYDIYVSRIDPSGEVDWTRQIHRRMELNFIPKQPLFFAVCDNNGLNIVYNDNPINSGHHPQPIIGFNYNDKAIGLKYVHFDVSGESSYKNLDQGEGNGKFLIHGGHSYKDEKKSYMVSRSKKKDRIDMLTFTTD